MKLDLSTRLREAVAAGGLGAFTQVVAADLKISSPATVFAAVAELRDGSFDFLAGGAAGCYGGAGGSDALGEFF